MKISLINRIDEISRENWNRITGLDYPFIRHEFLYALEKSACVNEGTGWVPQHCLVYEKDELIALMPMYRKTHSHGEYVFDFEWAHAYQHHGLSYYPKWLTAIPFTPCEGERLFVKAGVDKESVLKSILSFITANAESENISTWHCLYPTLKEADLFKFADLTIREGVQFRWTNKGYRDFKDYLDSFNSKKRKTLLRERRFISDQGIALKQIHGKDITEEQLNIFFQFYLLTYLKRGNPPYLNLEFFKEIAETMPDQLLLILAVKDNKYVGAAFSLVGGDSFYGRYWGCYEEYHSLHFEACYYQGLEYCINNQLKRFDSGAQGEHKLARGFEPVTTYSAHWICDPEFAAAINDFTKREASLMEKYRSSAAELLPFKK
ncbi:MAG: GNAT family N-acetyltransferase [Proteobacteria bacterium]|nr:GNAT family N-acetyltransferase [Pseudomonadota bacterium]